MYVLLADRIAARAMSERGVDATLKAAGFKRGGEDIVLADPDTALEEFDQRLNRPLNWDRLRAAMLREVSGL